MRPRLVSVAIGAVLMTAAVTVAWAARAWVDIADEAEASVYRVQEAAIAAQAARFSAHLELLHATGLHLASHPDDVAGALWSTSRGVGATPGRIRVVQLWPDGTVRLDSQPGTSLADPELAPGLHWVELEQGLQVVDVVVTADGGRVWVMEPAADFSEMLRSPWSWVVGPERTILAHADAAQVGTRPFEGREGDAALDEMLAQMAAGREGSATYRWRSGDGPDAVRMASFAPVRSRMSGVSVGTSVDHSSALAGVARARLRLGLAALALVLLCAGTGTALLWVQARARVRARRFADERLAMTRAAAHGERLALLGTLTAGVAHDLRGPLSAVRALSELLLDTEDEEEADDIALELDEAITALADMVAELTSFARRTGDATTRPAEAVAFAARMLRARLGRTVELEVALAVLPQVSLDSRRLSQAVLNLAINAEQAGARHIRITGRATGTPDGPWVELCVEDDGPGVPHHLRARLFEPFFTTKADGEGTGLGLHLVRSFLAEAGGTVEIEDSDLGGARFRLRLPGLTTQAVAWSERPSEGVLAAR